MIRKVAALGMSLALMGAPLLANEGAVPTGIPHLDHVFVIMMENHAYRQIINNPNAPFINYYSRHANLATNYFGIAHPSLTNYLEVVGGSNFGVHADNSPDWHNTSCATNLSHLRFTLVENFAPFKLDASAGDMSTWRKKTHERTRQSAFAATRFAEHTENFSRAQNKTDALKRWCDIGARILVAHAEVTDFKHGRHREKTFRATAGTSS